MFAQGQMTGIGYGGVIIPILIIIIIYIAYTRRSGSSDVRDTKSSDWFDESSPATIAQKVALIEGLHTLLMFLFIIPFYLYGGSILYGYTLLSFPYEVASFVFRASITVLIAEVVFNWIPHFGFRLIWWRKGWLHVILSGVLFSLLAYFVIPPPYYEGEATIGIGIVWVVGGIIIHKIFKTLGWYRREYD